MVDKPQAEGLKLATEKTKQIITLSTGVITLTVTFFDKFGTKAEETAPVLPWTLYAAWICFGLAIICAVWCLGAITGTLDSLDRKANGLPMNEHQLKATNALSNGRNIRIPAVAMDLLFLVAMCLTVLSGFAKS